MKSIQCILLSLLISICCSAQRFNNISTYTTQNGLSNNTITSLQKDAAGYLWIGTHEGLNRYDGTAFMNVLSNSKNNLPSNNINSICFIDTITLAVATDAGLCLLNTQTGEGKRIELPFNKDYPVSAYFIESILFDKEKRELWAGTWQGLFVLDMRGVVQRKIMSPVKDLPRASFAKHILKDNEGRVYVYSHSMLGFFYPNFKSGILEPVEKTDRNFPLNEYIAKGYSVRSALQLGNEVTCILSKYAGTKSDEFLFYTNNSTGQQLFDRVSVDFEYEKRFSNAYPLSDSVFLVNSYFGEPLLYNSINHTTRRASAQALWFTSWPDGIGTFVLKDERNTWIGTAKGLLQSSEKTGYFKRNETLTSTINSYGGLVSYNYALYSENKLWVACMGAGLFSLDTVTNNVTALFNRSGNARFSSKLVSTQVLKAGKAIWLFSVYGPVETDWNNQEMRPVSGINKHHAFDESAGFPFADSKHNIWTTLPNGVSRFDINGGLFTNYTSKYAGGKFPLLRAGPKTEDGKGNIWMARQDTLVKYDPSAATFTTTLLQKDGKSLRPVTSLASDGDDILYISVAGSLALYHISNGAIDLYTKQTGIISTAINEIVTDKSGNAWIATEAGLVYYNKERKKFSSFTRADGLPDDNIISLNFADAQKQQLFLGFAKTYSIFEPGIFLVEKSVPVNRITNVEVNGELFAIAEKPVLSHRQNSISFSYTGINFNQGQQNNYACFLEGFDQDWKYQGSERKINYVNLPPGKYTFRVKTANHQGEWNEQAAAFAFEIRPPFWQRLWFRVLLIAAIVAGLYFFIKRRESAIQRANATKLQMSELRMQALRAQMNPHFIFNSLNSIQSYILSNNTMDAASYLSKFAKLMRRILDQSKHNFLPLSEVIETLRMYVEIEAFRFNNEFSYTISIDEDDDLVDLPVPPMLLQPFVENAILHGLMPKAGEKKLTIHCFIIGSLGTIEIDDNGVGRSNKAAKAGHESQGEKLTIGMLESLQQLKNTKASIDITDKMANGTPQGTTVRFTFPLK